MPDHSFDEKDHDYILTLNDNVNPTAASYYIWNMPSNHWFATDIEKITGKRVKRLYDHYYGNGHGGFRIELEGSVNE